MSAWHPGLRNKGAKKRVSEDGVKSPLKKVKVAEEKKSTSSTAPQTVTIEEEITEKPTKEKAKKKKKKVSLEGGVQIQTAAKD